MNFLACTGFSRPVSLLLLAFAVVLTLPAALAVQVLLPRTGIAADELALIIKDDDQLSRQIGEYYQKVCHIPSNNLIHLRFPPGCTALGKDEFAELKTEIDSATPAHIQA